MEETVLTLFWQVVGLVQSAAWSVVGLLGWWRGPEVATMQLLAALVASVVAVVWAVGRKSLVWSLIMLIGAFVVTVPAVATGNYYVLSAIIVIGGMALLRRGSAPAAGQAVKR